jgi:hypothetical protein
MQERPCWGSLAPRRLNGISTTYSWNTAGRHGSGLERLTWASISSWQYQNAAAHSSKPCPSLAQALPKPAQALPTRGETWVSVNAHFLHHSTAINSSPRSDCPRRFARSSARRLPYIVPATRLSRNSKDVDSRWRIWTTRSCPQKPSRSQR